MVGASRSAQYRADRLCGALFYSSWKIYDSARDLEKWINQSDLISMLCVRSTNSHETSRNTDLLRGVSCEFVEKCFSSWLIIDALIETDPARTNGPQPSAPSGGGLSFDSNSGAFRGLTDRMALPLKFQA